MDGYIRVFGRSVMVISALGLIIARSSQGPRRINSKLLSLGFVLTLLAAGIFSLLSL